MPGEHFSNSNIDRKTERFLGNPDAIVTHGIESEAGKVTVETKPIKSDSKPSQQKK
jgi:hypothetical protein